MTVPGTTLAQALRLNTRLLENAFRGVAEEDAARRVDPAANSFAFVAAHAVDARYYLASLVDVELENPLEEALADATGIDDVERMPTLGEVSRALARVSPALEERVGTLTGDALGRSLPVDFPIDDDTLRGAIVFLLQHESYHLGQLGMLRKLLGYEAMSWEVSAEGGVP